LGFTWVIVWNKAPDTLCSVGPAILETKRVPEAKTKSAPNTEKIAPGKPNAQYGAFGMMTANKMGAQAVKNVPIAVERVSKLRIGS
jgi:hypothetical protein